MTADILKMVDRTYGAAHMGYMAISPMGAYPICAFVVKSVPQIWGVAVPQIAGRFRVPRRGMMNPGNQPRAALASHHEKK